MWEDLLLARRLLFVYGQGGTAKQPRKEWARREQVLCPRRRQAQHAPAPSAVRSRAMQHVCSTRSRANRCLFAGAPRATEIEGGKARRGAQPQLNQWRLVLQGPLSTCNPPRA